MGQCPHCRAQRPPTKCEKLLGYGASAKTCTECGKVFLDKGIREVALSHEEVPIPDNIFKCIEWIALFFLGLIGTIAISLSVTRGNTFGRTRIFLWSLIAPFVMIGGFVMAIVEAIQFSIKLPLVKIEYKKSKQRISSPEYMELLRSLDYSELKKKPHKH